MAALVTASVYVLIEFISSRISSRLVKRKAKNFRGPSTWEDSVTTSRAIL